MLSNFFIDRPIFATVIAVIMVMIGAVSISVLPTAHFPFGPSAPGSGAGELPGRQQRSGRRERDPAARRGDQWDRRHDLHVLDQRQPRVSRRSPSRSRWVTTSTSARLMCSTRFRVRCRGCRKLFKGLGSLSSSNHQRSCLPLTSCLRTAHTTRRFSATTR